MNDLIKIREKVASLHVLVVDDEDELRESIIKFMKKFFTCVDGAQNGEVALNMLQKEGQYDIVITDVRMPKMSGWELLKAIKTLDKELFVTVMTGSPELDGGQKDDCDLYLSKPIDIEKMQLMMEMIIKKKGL